MSKGHDETRGVSELDALVKRLAEQRRQTASNSEAIRRARQAIKKRGQFIPKQVTSTKRVTGF